jgi:hypothetical protein
VPTPANRESIGLDETLHVLAGRAGGRQPVLLGDRPV